MSNFIHTQGWLTYNTTPIHCKSITWNESANQIPVDTDGFPAPILITSTNKNPIITFTSEDVLGCLAAFGLLNNPIASNTVSIYYQSTANEGVRGSGSVNTKLVINTGMVIINTISLAQKPIATISGTIYPTSSDGFTAPITVSEESVALPSQSVFTQVLTLGPVSLNSTAINRIQSVTLSTNNSVNQVVSDGNYFCTEVELLSYKPSFSINGQSPAAYRNLIGDTVLALDGTNGLVVQCLETGTSGATSSTVGRTFTMKNGQAMVNDRNSSQGSVVSSTITVMASKPSSSISAIIVS